MANHQHLLLLKVTLTSFVLLSLCVSHIQSSTSVIPFKIRNLMSQKLKHQDANSLFSIIPEMSRGRFPRDAHSRPRPPHISEHPEDVSVRKQEPTTFNCKAEGYPPPAIEWYKDGKKVKNTGNRMVLPSGSLFFLHVLQRDTGTYYCMARNGLGTDKSREAILSLPSPTKSPPATPPPPVPSRISPGSELGAIGYGTIPHFLSGITNQSALPPHIYHEFNNIHNHHPFLVEKDQRSGYFQDPLKQSWLIIIIALTVMFILSSAVLIYLMRQRSVKKRPIQRHITSTIPKNNSLENSCSLIHEAVWIDQQSSSSCSIKKNHLQSSVCNPLVPTASTKLQIKNWSPPQHATPSHMAAYRHNYEMQAAYEDPVSNNDYAEVNDAPNHFSTFGSRRNGDRSQSCHSPGPYATTNLINITSNPYQHYYSGHGGSRAAHYVKNISAPSPSPSSNHVSNA